MTNQGNKIIANASIKDAAITLETLEFFEFDLIPTLDQIRDQFDDPRVFAFVATQSLLAMSADLTRNYLAEGQDDVDVFDAVLEMLEDVIGV